MAYNNLAYSYDNLSRMEDEDARIREEKKNAEKKLKILEQRRLNFFVVCAIVLISMAAYFMISKNVQVHETADKIKSLEKELSMLESKSSQKIFELEQSVDLDEVEKIATTRLNMQRPEKYQTVYINVPVDDVTEVTSNDSEGIANNVGSVAEHMKRNFFGIFDLGLE